MENNSKKKIMFVCAENAGRSQMAEAIFNHYALEKGINWQAESGGTFPSDKINPLVTTVMREKGIDLKNAKPKQFVPEKVEEYARVISFGCLVKSAFPKKFQERIEEWHIDDPKDQSIEKIRQIRNQLKRKMVTLINGLV